LDGANIEIRERVGAENMFIFGMTADDVERRRQEPADTSCRSPRLSAVLNQISAGAFSPAEPSRFQSLVEGLMTNDHFMVAADFDAYWTAQRCVDELWRDQAAWWRASVLNTARVGWFSADRTIREYADEIWKISGR
jgi:starch phosphorylase